MLYYQLVIAAFIALASEVIGAPIKSAKPFIIKGNDKNILVTGTAIGGGELTLFRFQTCLPRPPASALPTALFCSDMYFSYAPRACSSTQLVELVLT
jgi:hypothetical protein